MRGLPGQRGQQPEGVVAVAVDSAQHPVHPLGGRDDDGKAIGVTLGVEEITDRLGVRASEMTSVRTCMQCDPLSTMPTFAPLSDWVRAAGLAMGARPSAQGTNTATSYCSFSCSLLCGAW
jgi:hypothetical protein